MGCDKMEEFEGVKREEKKKKERHCTEQNNKKELDWQWWTQGRSTLHCIAVRTNSEMGEHSFQLVQGDGTVLVGVVLIEQFAQRLTIHIICKI